MGYFMVKALVLAVVIGILVFGISYLNKIDGVSAMEFEL